MDYSVICSRSIKPQGDQPRLTKYLKWGKTSLARVLKQFEWGRAISSYATLAGTRCGENPAEDAALEKDLLSDPKERVILDAG